MATDLSMSEQSTKKSATSHAEIRLYATQKQSRSFFSSIFYADFVSLLWNSMLLWFLIGVSCFLRTPYFLKIMFQSRCRLYTRTAHVFFCLFFYAPTVVYSLAISAAKLTYIIECEGGCKWGSRITDIHIRWAFTYDNKSMTAERFELRLDCQG